MYQYITALTQSFAAGAACDPNGVKPNFLGFPTWYEYLGGVDTGHGCSPAVTSLSDVWLIGAAIIDIMLRIAALGAIIFVLYGGFQFITSHGDPNSTKQARQTVVNALIGLVIAVAASAIVTFIAGQFK